MFLGLSFSLPTQVSFFKGRTDVVYLRLYGLDELFEKTLHNSLCHTSFFACRYRSIRTHSDPLHFEAEKAVQCLQFLFL